jgi:hypothetical protein
MPREIELPNYTRTFRRTGPDSQQLFRTGSHIGHGAKITIDEPCSMVYDHKDQVVVRVLSGYGQGDEYLLLNEIGLPELSN